MTWLLTLLVFFHSSRAFAEQVAFPILVKEGSAGEILQSDAVVPAQEGELSGPSGTGSVFSGLQDRLPVSLVQSGRPGNLAQLRGYGLSAEDIDVQAFGVSLNPPQGLGFDFSAFPFFLWSGFSFQSGPSLNGLNPGAKSGTLVLRPWTLEALKQSETRFQWGEYYSSSGVNQIFVGGQQGDSLALILGYSSLRSVGPSGGATYRWTPSERYQGNLHLLATDLDSETQGSISYPTPLARMRSRRLLSVLENQLSWGSSARFRSSLSGDLSSLGWVDPSAGMNSTSVIQQVGLENSLEVIPWKWGASLRRVHYFGSDFEAPLQLLANFQASRIFGYRTWVLEPIAQLGWVTGYGWMPQGSVGFRNDWGERQPSVYLRVGYSQKVPSLVDRYFNTTPFVGNPNLATEENYTLSSGLEWKPGSWEGGLHVFGQFKDHVRVLVNRDPSAGGMTVTNLGGATVLGIQNTLAYQLGSGWEFNHALSLSPSSVSATGKSYPYLPFWTEILGATLRWGKASSSGSWTTTARFSGKTGIGVFSDRELEPLEVIDLGLTQRVSRELRVALRVDNVFDRPIEWVAGYPVGRIVSILVSGQI